MSVVLLRQEGTNPDAAPVTFEEFWRAYQRRVAKKDVEKNGMVFCRHHAMLV